MASDGSRYAAPLTGKLRAESGVLSGHCQLWFLKGTVKPVRTRIKLLAQPKSMRSIGDATRQEQRHGLA